MKTELKKTFPVDLDDIAVMRKLIGKAVKFYADDPDNRNNEIKISWTYEDEAELSLLLAGQPFRIKIILVPREVEVTTEIEPGQRFFADIAIEQIRKEVDKWIALWKQQPQG